MYACTHTCGFFLTYLSFYQYIIEGINFDHGVVSEWHGNTNKGHCDFI